MTEKIEIPVKDDPDALYPITFRLTGSNDAKLSRLARESKRSKNEVINLLIQAGEVKNVGVKP